jgi:hypothetical protein
MLEVLSSNRRRRRREGGGGEEGGEVTFYQMNLWKFDIFPCTQLRCPGASLPGSHPSPTAAPWRRALKPF